jgi:hypothetical protein
MGKYKLANPEPLVTLKHNPYQVGAIAALLGRICFFDNTRWSAKPGQDDTLNCPVCGQRGERVYDRILLIAGRQGGKTRISTLMCILELSFSGVYGWITAPTYRDLTDFVEPTFFKQIPQSWVDEGDWSASDRILTLPNKSLVAFRSLEDPESARGPTLDFFFMDEAAKVAKRAWEAANPTLAIKRGVGMFSTTPAGEDWVYDDLWGAAEKKEPGWWATRYKSIDNPIMSPAYIESQRRQMSAEMFSQEYEADFVTFQGAIYGDLVGPCVIDDTTPEGLAILKRHIPEWPSIDASRSAVVGLDPGSDHPFAGVLGVATPNALVITDEYRERQLPAATHARNLKNIVGGLKPRWGIDRSQAQMQIELAQHGIFCLAAENKVTGDTGGIERVKTWMLSGQLLIVKSRCPRLIAELKSYRWAETEKNDGSTGAQQPYKRKDDLCDALRYLLMAWPQLPAVVHIEVKRDLSALPEKTRAEIERMNRHEAQEKKKKDDDGVGEFYDGDGYYDDGEQTMGMFEEVA